MTNAADFIWQFADGTPTLPVARNPRGPLDFAARYELHIASAVAVPTNALARQHELDHLVGDSGCALAVAWCVAAAAPQLRSYKPAPERHQTSLCGSAQHADGGHRRCSVHDPVEPPPPGRHPLIAQSNSLLLRSFRLPRDDTGVGSLSTSQPRPACWLVRPWARSACSYAEAEIRCRMVPDPGSAEAAATR